MNIKSLIKKAGMALAGAATFFALSGVAHAIPYTGPNTPNSPVPAFNVYSGVPAPWGNESDFLRSRVDDGSTTDYTDPLNTTCFAGQKIQMRVYVHNGAGVDGNQGGNGPSVAHNTKVKVSIPSNEGSKFVPNATISASNAATVNDNATINCGGKTFKLDYIKGSASQYSKGSGVVALSDSIVTTGASIKSHSKDGDVWGCWDERVYVVLSVKVTEVTKPQKSLGVCKAPDVKTYDNRKVQVTVHGSVDNAQIVGYKIDWGDDSDASYNQTDTHTYAKDGKYTIQTSVKVKLADGKTKWVSGSECNAVVEFKSEQPPKVTPPTPKVLVNTGAGDVAGIFTGTSLLGAFLHRKWTLRRNK